MCQFIPNGGFDKIKVVGWECKQRLKLRISLLARLGLVTKKDAMLVSQRTLVTFQTKKSTFLIPRGYSLIAEKLQGLLLLHDPIPHLMVDLKNLSGHLLEIGD